VQLYDINLYASFIELEGVRYVLLSDLCMITRHVGCATLVPENVTAHNPVSKNFNVSV
jgi:hypothetical protein